MSQGPSTLGSMIDIELGAGGRHDLQDVVERPGRVERVDARPQPGLAEVVGPGHLDEAAPRRRLGVGGDGVLEVAEHDVDLADQFAAAGRGSSRCAAARSGPCARAARAAAGRAPARRRRAARNAWRACVWRTWRGPLLRCNNGHSRGSRRACRMSSRGERSAHPQRRLFQLHCSGASRIQASNCFCICGRDPFHVVGLAWPCAAP